MSSILVILHCSVYPNSWIDFFDIYKDTKVLRCFLSSDLKVPESSSCSTQVCSSFFTLILFLYLGLMSHITKGIQVSRGFFTLKCIGSQNLPISTAFILLTSYTAILNLHHEFVSFIFIRTQIILVEYRYISVWKYSWPHLSCPHKLYVINV